MHISTRNTSGLATADHTVPYGTVLSRTLSHALRARLRSVCPYGDLQTLCNGHLTSVPPLKSLEFRCVQNGSSARREEGAYLDRYVTDEQRSSRPIFNATLRAAASWLFFCVARSTVMIQIAALRSRLDKQPTDLRRSSRDLGDGTLGMIRLNRSGCSTSVQCPQSANIDPIDLFRRKGRPVHDHHANGIQSGG